jgi:hypothetical protein
MDLLNLQPTKISRDLAGTSWLIYGQPKSGKSTLASTFPKPIFLSTERGLNALPGVISTPVNSWAEFKQTVNELLKDAVRDTYETVIIDTLSNLIEYLDLYVGSQLTTEKATYKYGTDVEFGKGAVRLGKELNEQLQKLSKKGYTIVTIAHSEEKTHFKTRETMLTTSLDKKPGLIIDRFVDNILFLDSVTLKTGEVERRLYFRGTDKFKAGSRYKYVPAYCDATYEVLKETILTAIDKQEQETGAGSVTEQKRSEIEPDFEVDPEYDFEALLAEFKQTTKELTQDNPNASTQIKDIVEKELGVGHKVAELKKNQAELLVVINQNLKNLNNDNNKGE